MNNPFDTSPAVPHWFIAWVMLFTLLQTVLLALIYSCMNDWASKINRKLHRIESDAHHAAEAVLPEEQAERERVGVA
jgi:hypothetical protein